MTRSIYKIKIYRYITVIFIICHTKSFAGGDWTYIDEAILLTTKLNEILVQEKICQSVQQCQRDGGHTFSGSHGKGVNIYVYEISDETIIKKLTTECAIAFINRPLGTEMVIKIYDIPKLQRMKQPIFRKAQPIATLKLEKRHAND
jgi:hypothetical protein